MSTTNTVSPVTLQVQTIFGVRSKLESSLFFADEHTVIYPAGNQFVLANVETKSQRIFRCHELEHIEAMLVHSDAAIIAVVATAMHGDKESTTVSFYDLHSTIGKKKRTFTIHDGPTTITSIALSHDAKHFAVLECGNREYTLSIWQWQKSRLLASIKLGQVEGVTVLSQILFDPSDHNYLSIIGRRYCRFARHTEGNIRIQPSSAKLDQYDFISHAWYDPTRLIAGTSNGQVCVLFNGDVQILIDVVEGREGATTTLPRTLSTMSSATKSGARSALHQHQQEHLDTSRPSGEEVTSINTVNKGFYCLVGGKRLVHYSKIADSWDFAKTREYVVPANEGGTARSLDDELAPSQTLNDKQQMNNEQVMWKVAVSPKEEHTLVLTSKQQIYSVSDIAKDHSAESGEAFVLELVFNSYHQSSIRGLDIGVHKPLFVSSGEDHTVRLWNYETNALEQMRLYTEPVYAISIHPNALQIVVAFASRVSLMNILVDGFSTVKEFAIRAAHQIKFSHGGQLFAVIDSDIIQVISPLYLKVFHRLNHGQTIKTIVWKQNDLGLYSQSSNCFIIWNLETQSRTYELKTNYRLDGGLAIDKDDRFVYIASDDGLIREIQNEKIKYEVKLPNDDKPSYLEMFESNGTILCGTHRGSIYVIRTPFGNAPHGIFHYLAHSARVTHIVVAFHEELVISSCEDGVLMLWGTHIKSTNKTDKWTSVVLQNQKRFLSLPQKIRELQTEEEELKRDHEYRLQQMETTYLGDLQRRTDMSENERRHHENQIDIQLSEKEKEQRDFETKHTHMRENFDSEKQRIEKEDRERMGREFHKEEELIHLSQKMMEDNEFRLKSTEEAGDNEVRDVKEFYQGKIKETEKELAALKIFNKDNLKKFEIEKQNIEHDVEDEQLKHKLEYEEEKKRLLEHNAQLTKTFKETLEHQVHALEAKKTEQNTTAQTYKKKIQEHNNRVQGMTQEIAALKNEITERNHTVHDKLDRINDLGLKNQELEKFQYVLNYKIDELTRLIKPREEEIARMQNQLLKMTSEREKKENELSQNRFVNVGQRRTLHAIEEQIERERRKRKEYDSAMRRIKNDILTEFSDVSDPKRTKDAVGHLYQKHVENDNARSIYTSSDPNDGMSEEAIAQDRQRMFLERTTANLKTKLSSDLSATKANRMRIMNENSLLLQELNNLREELRIVRGRLQDYDVARQTFGERGVHSTEALIQTLNADAGNYAVRHRDNELMKEIHNNQQEIIRLRQRLTRTQAGYKASDQFLMDVDENDDTANVSIIKLA
ncbi:unnamed protein product [Adineta steineri]|uniref:WD repeat-containing protein 65 n=1 Tax=Adineta steineri TaxID=433720 RepID=A0A819EBN8_9BILA|nr:unnamed protein product [Adineta steineri]CAF1122511.1 unnamed protein product [Adineta steineri]CAF3665329.1 unnamed protein product [Adineta steineri]CAF3848104.1 unnamed protein product [Adineta steineri]